MFESRSSHGSADRNLDRDQLPAYAASRSSHGSADRNIGPPVSKAPKIRSLLARERGSKQPASHDGAGADLSLLARERGSKRTCCLLPSKRSGRSSHGSADRNNPHHMTARVRTCRSSHGSADRNAHAASCHPKDRVAPRTGARIETVSDNLHHSSRRVAPRTGARIETFLARPPAQPRLSLLARERGSKRRERLQRTRRGRRSSHGSADRNTWTYERSWQIQVAPRTGARIETSTRRGRGQTGCRSSHGSADRNAQLVDDVGLQLGRSSHGSADRNAGVGFSAIGAPRRSSHGSADRNIPQTPYRTNHAGRSSHGSADRNQQLLPKRV